jgi:hypothetical protein
MSIEPVADKNANQQNRQHQYRQRQREIQEQELEFDRIAVLNQYDQNQSGQNDRE